MSSSIDFFNRKRNIYKTRSDINLYEIVSKVSEHIFSNYSDLLNKVSLSQVNEKELERAIEKEIHKQGYSELKQDIINHILGYGPLEQYIKNEECSNVFINSHDDVWVQIGRERIKTSINFGNLLNLNYYIRTIQGALGGSLNENEALVKFSDEKNRLRIVCAINPISHLSSTVAIRKHRLNSFTLEDLLDMDMFNEELYGVLKNIATSNLSVMFTGSGGAGKTTLMRAMIEIIDPSTRILVMEEHPELFIKRDNTTQFLTKRDKGRKYTISEFTDFGNLMSIDMYVFGEIRGAEALPFFDGAFAGNVTWNTTHANSSLVALKKMAINMKKAGTDIPIEVFEEQLYDSVDLIIHLDRFRVTEISEVTSDKKINMVYKFKKSFETETFIEGKYEKISDFTNQKLINKVSDLEDIKGGAIC